MDEVVRNVPAALVGARVTVWMGSNPKRITIEKQDDGLFTITIKL